MKIKKKSSHIVELTDREWEDLRILFLRAYDNEDGEELDHLDSLDKLWEELE
jgi:hypothetical protein